MGLCSVCHQGSNDSAHLHYVTTRDMCLPPVSKPTGPLQLQCAEHPRCVGHECVCDVGFEFFKAKGQPAYIGSVHCSLNWVLHSACCHECKSGPRPNRSFREPCRLPVFSAWSVRRRRGHRAYPSLVLLQPMPLHVNHRVPRPTQRDWCPLENTSGC